jgi:hypothetical protein
MASRRPASSHVLQVDECLIDVSVVLAFDSRRSRISTPHSSSRRTPTLPQRVVLFSAVPLHASHTCRAPNPITLLPRGSPNQKKQAQRRLMALLYLDGAAWRDLSIMRPLSSLGLSVLLGDRLWFARDRRTMSPCCLHAPPVPAAAPGLTVDGASYSRAARAISSMDRRGSHRRPRRFVVGDHMQFAWVTLLRRGSAAARRKASTRRLCGARRRDPGAGASIVVRAIDKEGGAAPGRRSSRPGVSPAGVALLGHRTEKRHRAFAAGKDGGVGQVSSSRNSLKPATSKRRR